MGSWSQLPWCSRPLPLWLFLRRFARGPEGRASRAHPRIPSRKPRLLILFCLRQEVEFQVDVSEYLGRLLFVKLRKRHLLSDDAWFCNWISVQGPGASGNEFRFPCYRWVEGDGILSLPEGTGEPRGAWECKTPGAGEKLRGRREGSWPLGSQKRQDAVAGTGQWRLGEGRDAEGSGASHKGGLRVPWQGQGRGSQEEPYSQCPSPHFQVALWSMTLKVCSRNTGKRSWQREGSCTGQPHPCLLAPPGSCRPFPSTNAWFLFHCRWGNWKDGLILNIAGATINDLPVDERFLEDKRIDFEASLTKG